MKTKLVECRRCEVVFGSKTIEIETRDAKCPYCGNRLFVSRGRVLPVKYVNPPSTQGTECASEERLISRCLFGTTAPGTKQENRTRGSSPLLVVYLILALAVLFVAVAFFVQKARASESIRCNGRIVTEGDPEVELFMKCGRPTYSSGCSDEDFEFGRHHGTRSCVVTHYYDRGSNLFVKAITVKRGRVISIVGLDYGR